MAVAISTLALAVLVLVGEAGAKPYRCRASWYQSGTHTATGERYRPDGLTAAHRSYAFGTRLRVKRGHHKVVVRVNDRGPAKWTGRCLDLSRGAAGKIGMIQLGVALVEIEVLD